MHTIQRNVEFRIMPSGDGCQWYWEVIHDNHSIVSRGLAVTETAACKEASDAARNAKLIQWPTFSPGTERSSHGNWTKE
jgi:hypothetical protein